MPDEARESLLIELVMVGLEYAQTTPYRSPPTDNRLVVERHESVLEDSPDPADGRRIADAGFTMHRGKCG